MRTICLSASIIRIMYCWKAICLSFLNTRSVQNVNLLQNIPLEVHTLFPADLPLLKAPLELLLWNAPELRRRFSMMSLRD